MPTNVSGRCWWKAKRISCCTGNFTQIEALGMCVHRIRSVLLWGQTDTLSCFTHKKGLPVFSQSWPSANSRVDNEEITGPLFITILLLWFGLIKRCREAGTENFINWTHVLDNALLLLLQPWSEFDLGTGASWDGCAVTMVHWETWWGCGVGSRSDEFSAGGCDTVEVEGWEGFVPS